MSSSYVDSDERAATLAKVANRTAMREDARRTKMSLARKVSPNLRKSEGMIIMSTFPKTTSQQEFSLSELVPEVQQRLVEFGAPLLLTEVEGRLALAERKIKAFEQKHGTTLAQLLQNGLPDDASLEMHEDYVEWSGWQRTHEESSQILASLKPILENPRALAAAS
jgi:hypothetical protein